MDIEQYLLAMIEQQTKEENENQKLFNKYYEDILFTILSNGNKWRSDQNRYGVFDEFKLVDNLVYIISDFVMSFYKHNNIDLLNEEYDESAYFKFNKYDCVFKCRRVDGQGTFYEIIRFGEYDCVDCPEIEDIVNFINTTNEWRTFDNE